MKNSLVHSLSIVTAAFILAATVGLATRAAPQTAPAKEIPASNETFTRTIEDGGTGPYKAVLAADATLPTHTIFRPKELEAFGEKKLPIIAWGNGGCANSPQPVQNYLSEIASHGFLVIAIGPTQAADVGRGRGNPPGGGTRSSQLLDAIDWATTQNTNKQSIYFGKIDSSKIAVIGTSCGGLQALEVSPDPRITTTVVANSGVLNTAPAVTGTARAAAAATVSPTTTPAPTTSVARGSSMPGMPPLTKDHLAKLHAPVLYMLGGQSDMATPNGADDFRRIEKVPAYFASMDVGHGGTFARPHGGEFATVSVAWLKWQLKGDAEAAKLFTAAPSGLSKMPGWTLEKKNVR